MTNGIWKKRTINDGGLTLAIFEEHFTYRESVYTREALEFVLNTVKNHRSSYATQEAYDAMLAHFNEGLDFCRENSI